MYQHNTRDEVVMLGKPKPTAVISDWTTAPLQWPSTSGTISFNVYNIYVTSRPTVSGKVATTGTTSSYNPLQPLLVNYSADLAWTTRRSRAMKNTHVRSNTCGLDKLELVPFAIQVTND